MKERELFGVEDFGVGYTPRYIATVRVPGALGRMGGVVGFGTKEGPCVSAASNESPEEALDAAFMKLGKIANRASGERTTVVDPTPVSPKGCRCGVVDCPGHTVCTHQPGSRACDICTLDDTDETSPQAYAARALGTRVYSDGRTNARRAR